MYFIMELKLLFIMSSRSVSGRAPHQSSFIQKGFLFFMVSVFQAAKVAHFPMPKEKVVKI